MAETQQEPVFDIPKTCKAGVVVDEGPNFRVEVQDVPVPEIRTSSSLSRSTTYENSEPLLLDTLLEGALT